MPAVRQHEGDSEGVMLRWGLIPSWVEGEPSGPPQACVGSDHIERSKNYGTPWLNCQHCILPVAGFYAWQLTQEKYRQPFFSLIGRSVFGIAAIWDRWNGENDDDVIESCAIICVPPNELLADIIGARRGMPAILRLKDYQTWLRDTLAEARSALRPYNPRWMERIRSVRGSMPPVLTIRH